jgi:TPR repeat protein
MIIFTLIIAASLPVLFYLLSKKKTVSSNPPAENSSFLVDSPEDELMQNLGDRFKKYMGSLSDDNLDFNELAKEVKLFADNGLCEAQWMLGSLYFNGTKDFASDDKQAFDYFMLAAEQGLPAAQSKLAQMYIDGLGVEKDQDKAKHYLYLALEQGDASAQLRLGKLFLDGADHNRKGDVDLSKWARGIHYLTLAANQDNEDAKKLNNFAKSRLTDLLIAEKKRI